MSWPFTIIGVVLVGVLALLGTMRGIHRANDELAHYRLSVRFWALLAGLGVVLMLGFVYPIRIYGMLDNEAGLVSVLLMSVLPAIVVFAGLRNSITLALAHRRRRRALATGTPVAGRVVDRTRRALAHDLMAVTVEADLPDVGAGSDLAYRSSDAERVRTRRFVETCPTDHWARFEPGTRVVLRYDPADLGTYAVLLFAPP